MRTSLLLTICALAAMACGPKPGSGGTGGGSGGGTGGGGVACVPPAGDGGATTTMLPAIITTDLTVEGDVRAAATTTIQSGATLTIGPCSVVRFAAGAGLAVEGRLVTRGTKSGWVELDSDDRTGTALWAGLTVKPGGTATLSHTGFHNALVAFASNSGSSYDVTGFQIDGSSIALSLSSTGAFRYGVVRGLGLAQANGVVAIVSASPSFTDVRFEKGSSGVDFITIGGGGPTFDHVEISDSHCAFHFNEGSNITVSNSSVHDNAYAVMHYFATNTRFTNVSMTMNAFNIGACSAGGTFVGSGNYAAGMMFDASCASQTNGQPASAPLTGVGPRLEP